MLQVLLVSGLADFLLTAAQMIVLADFFTTLPLTDLFSLASLL
jgi:hypothetical protein